MKFSKVGQNPNFSIKFKCMLMNQIEMKVWDNILE